MSDHCPPRWHLKPNVLVLAPGDPPRWVQVINGEVVAELSVDEVAGELNALLRAEGEARQVGQTRNDLAWLGYSVGLVLVIVGVAVIGLLAWH